MTFRRQVVVAAALTLASISSARAQAPLTEKNVSMKMALAIIEGAIEQCTKDGYKVSVVIVSNDGVVRASLRDNPASAYLKQIPDVVAVGGGVPIRVGNVPIGAVGVSGAPGGEKDEVCANAGIAKVAEHLK